MPKAYWIANSDVTDMAGLYRYREANRDTMNRYGAKFIVMHGRERVVEGVSRSKQTVVEFPTYEAALACYDDPTYHEAAKIRHAIAAGDMVIVEGYDGTQDF
ncbi:MAG: DUF1330 domain-containing protein [Cytophagaceae bacterium]|nr:DUF1330 domain-containing protein [Gemmatimonadaceae bacterium]